jgi:DNA-binding transcriptional LysR family regulator
MHEVMFPVCNRAIAASIREPADVLRFPLLRDTHCPNDWEIWLEAAGVRATARAPSHSFSLFSMVIQAAMKGLGICMAHGVPGRVACRDTRGTIQAASPSARFILHRDAKRPEHQSRCVALAKWLVSEADAPA